MQQTLLKPSCESHRAAWCCKEGFGISLWQYTEMKHQASNILQQWMKGCLQLKLLVINRPGVAGAVLQTALSLVQSLIH